MLDPSRGGYDHTKRAAFAAADAALAASGTVALELAASATPMVAAYNMNWLTQRIVLSKLQVDTANLINLVSQTRTVPEFLGPHCRPDPIGRALIALLRDPAAGQAQREAASLAMARLGRDWAEPPGVRAAHAVLAALSRG